MPQEPAIIAFGVESSIRVANSLAAKPPKTTECIAPIRATASIAIIASGTIGIYIITRSPFWIPFLISAPANKAIFF